MGQQKHSLQQVAVALLNAALSLEYYMLETYHIYKDEQDKMPDWRNSLAELLNWSLEESYESRIDVHDLETWSDELLIKEFIPLVERFIEKPQVVGGKLAFTVLALSYVLEMYLSIPQAFGREKIVLLLSQFKEYLYKKWQVDLNNGMIHPNLGDFCVPMAREFAQRWRTQLDRIIDE